MQWHRIEGRHGLHQSSEFRTGECGAGQDHSVKTLAGRALLDSCGVPKWLGIGVASNRDVKLDGLALAVSGGTCRLPVPATL